VPHLLHNLLTAASKSGNFLLNVGPDSDGVVPVEEADRLRAIGAWLRKNGESYYGSERCGLSGATNGVWTRKGKNYYFHIFRWYGGTATIALTKGPVKSACILATGRKVKWTYASNGRIVFYGMPVKPPDPFVTTLKVEFERPPERYAEKDITAWLEGKA
jgi:alpha-L-fucosidase